MDSARLIEARMQGAAFDRILHAVRTDRETVSSLPDDQLEFLESMLSEIRTATDEMSEALKADKLQELRAAAQSVRDIFLMIEDTCG